jgi:hypothetical protein
LSLDWPRQLEHMEQTDEPYSFRAQGALGELTGVRNLVEILADGTTEVEMEQRESWEFISRIMRPGKLVYL